MPNYKTTGYIAISNIATAMSMSLHVQYSMINCYLFYG